MKKHILVTGGAGFIGSHTVLELLQKGYKVTVIDNLSNSHELSLKRVEELTGQPVQFIPMDLLDKESLFTLFSEQRFDSVIHFAGLKAVGESVEKPLYYYKNNISGTLNLCEAMLEYNVTNIIFSSSATVYGDPSESPLKENSGLKAVNPYGRTKLYLEEIFRDLCAARPRLHAIMLRYFNPVGAHPSGRIGEDPSGIPNNLMPYVTQVAVGKLPRLYIFGDDYPTEDGTGVRDYIHVSDLARGHMKALDRFGGKAGFEVYNLGTGKGYSVLEIVKTFERVTGVRIPYEITERRSGDAAACFADPAKAEKELNWRAEKNLADMCRDAWNWQQKNPNGYRPCACYFMLREEDVCDYRKMIGWNPSTPAVG